MKGRKTLRGKSTRARRRVREPEAGYETYPSRALLLDTHVWLWWNAGGAELGPRAIQAIRGARDLRFSVASVWELAIKQALGKLRIPVDHSRIPDELARQGIALLPIEVRHTTVVARLPLWHRDPFDRLLVAQAMVEGLVLVTDDAALARYGINVLAAKD